MAACIIYFLPKLFFKEPRQISGLENPASSKTFSSGNGFGTNSTSSSFQVDRKSPNRVPEERTDNETEFGSSSQLGPRSNHLNERLEVAASRSSVKDFGPTPIEDSSEAEDGDDSSFHMGETPETDSSGPSDVEGQ